MAAAFDRWVILGIILGQSEVVDERQTHDITILDAVAIEIPAGIARIADG